MKPRTGCVNMVRIPEGDPHEQDPFIRFPALIRTLRPGSRDRDEAQSEIRPEPGEGSDAVVTVRDNGMGIPGDMLSSVFDIFTQVSRSLEQSQGGLGIGLSLVKRFVEMHGGTVQVRSEGPGTGSEFTVRLRVAAPKDRKGA